MARIRPFRALRYDLPDLAPVVAPPYDVLSAEQRAEYLARSPYNVVHLTLPDSEEQAARDLAAWQDAGVLVRDDGARVLVARAGLRRPGRRRPPARTGFVASLHAEPYEARVVLPHERTHAGPKEGRLRLLRATRTQLEPLFFLWDGTIEVDGLGEPDLEVDGDKLWRLDAGFGDALAEELAEAQLLIADGHHRYETALAFGESPWLLAVIVPTDQEGLTIFPTHRVARSVNGATGGRSTGPATSCPASSSTADGHYELMDGEGLDPEIVDALKPEGVTYTPQRAEAEAAVDRGEAEAAFLLRPPRIEDVWEVAGRGDVMPQKSTFFYPKLTSGLLFHPLD